MITERIGQKMDTNGHEIREQIKTEFDVQKIVTSSEHILA